MTDPDALTQLLERWTTSLDALSLRVEPDDDNPEHLSVLIGQRGYQGIELSLAPAQSWGQKQDSQSCERYAQGAVQHTTAWDDEWTDHTPEGGLAYVDWVEGSLRAVVAGHLGWGIESIYQESDPADTLLQTMRELKQVEALGVDLDYRSETLLALAGLADVLIDASQGDVQAVEALGAAAVSCTGGLDDTESVFAILVGAGASALREPDLDGFLEAVEKRLESETRRVCQASVSQPRAFHALKTVLDSAPTVMGHRINEWIQDEARAHEPDSEFGRQQQARINRYQKLHRDWQTYQPSAADPGRVGRDFLKLEEEINAAWRGLLEAETGLFRSELETRLTQDGRFLSGATGVVYGWMRNQGEYDTVVEGFSVWVQDSELLKLRQLSQPHAFEDAVSNSLGAFLDSGDEDHIPRAVACVDALEAVLEWKTGRVHYQLACVFSRAGLVERAIQAVERAVETGTNIKTMARDSDLDAVKTHPTFQRLLTESEAR